MDCHNMAMGYQSSYVLVIHLHTSRLSNDSKLHFVLNMLLSIFLDIVHCTMVGPQNILD